MYPSYYVCNIHYPQVKKLEYDNTHQAGVQDRPTELDHTSQQEVSQLARDICRSCESCQRDPFDCDHPCEICERCNGCKTEHAHKTYNIEECRCPSKIQDEREEELNIGSDVNVSGEGEGEDEDDSKGKDEVDDESDGKNEGEGEVNGDDYYEGDDEDNEFIRKIKSSRVSKGKPSESFLQKRITQKNKLTRAWTSSPTPPNGNNNDETCYRAVTSSPIPHRHRKRKPLRNRDLGDNRCQSSKITPSRDSSDDAERPNKRARTDNNNSDDNDVKSGTNAPSPPPITTTTANFPLIS